MRGDFLKTLLLILALTASCSLRLAAQTSSAVPVYLDPQQPVERRVDDLLSRMTLKEKVGQLNLPCVFYDELGKEHRGKDRGLQAICRRNVYE